MLKFEKENIMKIIILCFLTLLQTTNALSANKESFLKSWEMIQTNNPAIESFSKIEENKYRIKFSTLPYEGELIILNTTIDDFEGFGFGDSKIAKIGYVELDLPGLSDEMMQKYHRTYYNWTQTNSLYFNSKSQQWITQKELNKEMHQDTSGSFYMKFASYFFEYWNYILVFIILYFFFSSFQGNKKIKKSVQLQQEAFNKSTDLHKKTNELLSELLQEVKTQKNL